MSYDRLIDQVCPHYVIQEALFLLGDRQTVRPLRPIAAISSVKLRFNGEVDVPSPGSYVPAQATGFKSAPFKIQGGVNDTLVLKVGNGAFQTLKTPSGTLLSAAQIADFLNQSVKDAVFSATSKRQIRIKSSISGPAGTLFLRAAGSTAASVLGFQTDRGWQGKTIVPGWSIVNDPNTLSDRPTRLIVFDDVLKGLDDFVEINYTTLRQECRRCGGLGIENDWRFDGPGEVVKVRDENLLLQELLKATYTIQGSNPFHTWYGTTIVESIGRKLSATGITQNLIVSEVYEAFRRWQTIKQQQEQNVGQQVSDEEYPFRLLSVGLQQSDQDPTIIFVSATVQNRSNKPIQIERGLRTPIPLDLLSSTQQDAFFNPFPTSLVE